ncbi:MAG TPA: hypothetical protein VM434_13825 [Beijerinckiaceae bacterium]|nr:hypothetical protein [Beijerinckiaceae bacterium]
MRLVLDASVAIKFYIAHRAAALPPEAIDLAHRLVHRLHDCVYLALAIRSGCGLLTADEVLARKINLHGITPAPVLLSQARA